ncbi:MAG: hypothetical protein ACR2QH_15285 [Geminicoccaceae bacterium]
MTDFMSQERADIAQMQQQMGVPPRENPPAQPAPTRHEQPGPPMAPPEDRRPPDYPVHDAGLSNEVYTPPQPLPDQPATFAPPVEAQPPQQQQQQQPSAPPPPPGVMEERQRRQAIEQEMQQLRTQQQILTERLSMQNQTIMDAQQERMKQAQTPTLPDPKDDLEGYVTGLNDQYTREIQNIRQEQTQTTQALQDFQRTANVRAQASNQARAYQAEHPDFTQAYNFYRTSRMSELEAQGFDSATVAQAVDDEERNIFEAHLSAGRNVAEAVYNAARVRGWGAQQAQQQAPPDPRIQQQFHQGQYGGPTQVNPAQAQAPQPVYAAPQPVYQQPQQYYQPPAQPQMQTMQNMQAGMMAGQSLGDMAQSGAAAPMTLEAFANMPDSEFANHIDAVKRMLGAG